MLVLTVDTSTPAITAGVVELLLPHEVVAAQQEAGVAPGAPSGPVAADPVRVLAEDVVDDAFGHAEKLLPLITGVLTAADRTLQQLDAVVVGLGPGPFTGLRVGIVTAAALGDALGIGVHGVPSHDGTARSVARSGARPEDVPTAVLVVTDARRREVYVSGYAPDGRRILGPSVLAPAAIDVRTILDTGTDTEIRVVGPGVALVPAFSQQQRVAPGSLSRGLVLAAGRDLVTGVVPGPLVPLYLRRPDVSEPAAPKSTLNTPVGGRP